jgi:hypothetical protein
VPAAPLASPVAAVPGATPAAATSVYPPDAEVAGASQSEWMARRWQWLLGLPIGANPGQDASGAACGVGQGGPVFFLPSNLPPCEVPAGAPVVVPVIGSLCTTADPGVEEGETDLRACAEGDADRYTAVRVWVDGEELAGADAYRFTTDRFSAELPDHNILGAPAGEVEAAASGWQVILPPLTPGEHEVVVHAELTDGTVLPDSRAVLTVANP